jgi:hypothetical protein
MELSKSIIILKQLQKSLKDGFVDVVENMIDFADQFSFQDRIKYYLVLFNEYGLPKLRDVKMWEHENGYEYQTESFFGRLIDMINIDNKIIMNDNIKQFLPLFNKLCKDKLVREHIVTWFCNVINTNLKRVSITFKDVQENKEILSSDEFMIKVIMILNKLWKNGASIPRYKLLDYNWIVSKKCGLKWKSDVIQTASEDEYDTDSNFITKCFYMYFNALSIGYISLIRQIKNWTNDLHYINEGIGILKRSPSFRARQLLMEYQQNADILRTGLDNFKKILNIKHIKYEIDDAYNQIAYLMIKMKVKNFNVNDEILSDVATHLKNRTQETPPFGTSNFKINDVNMMQLLTRMIGCGMYTKNPHVRSEYLVLLTMIVENNVLNSDATEFRENIMEGLINLYNLLCSKDSGPNLSLLCKSNTYFLLSTLFRNSNYVHHYDKLYGKKKDKLKRFVNNVLNDIIFITGKLFEDVDGIKTINDGPDTPNERGETKDQQKKKHAKFIQNILDYFSMVLPFCTFLLSDKLRRYFVSLFMADEIVDSLTCNLNYIVSKLHGEYKQELVVKYDQMGENDHINFTDVLRYIIYIYSEMKNEKKFITHVVGDERSFDLSRFKELKSLVRRSSSSKSTLYIIGYETFLTNIAKEYEKQQMQIEVEVEYPDEFLDPLMCTPIEVPVLLPGTNQVMDKSVIDRLLMNNEEHPYTRAKLTQQMLTDFNNTDAAREQIDEFKAKLEEWKRSQ